MDFFDWRERRGESADPETERLAHLAIGAAIEVHQELGPGHAERTYHDAFCHELQLRSVAFEREFAVKLVYKGKPVGECYIDVLIGGKLIVELKAVEQLTELHRAQAMAYLAATGLKLALLINFSVPQLKLGIKRVVRDPN